jgi:hypothetical protein
MSTYKDWLKSIAEMVPIPVSDFARYLEDARAGWTFDPYLTDLHAMDRLTGYAPMSGTVAEPVHETRTWPAEDFPLSARREWPR